MSNEYEKLERRPIDASEALYRSEQNAYQDAMRQSEMVRAPYASISELSSRLAEAMVDHSSPPVIFQQLVSWITDFDSRVDKTHSTGARLVTFGQTIQFYLDSLTCSESPILLFKGCMEDGTPVELIQHISQMSILLITLPRKNPEEPKKPIGFITEGQRE